MCTDIFAQAENLRAFLNEYVENVVIDRHKELDENEDMNLVKLKYNNDLWRDLLNNKLPIDIVGVLSLEMEDRIIDLRNVKQVLLNKHEDINAGLSDIVDNIKIERHDKVVEMFENWADGNEEKFKQVGENINVNNIRWRNEIMARFVYSFHFEIVRLTQTNKHCKQTL